MPRGRPRGLLELPVAKRQRARRAREAKRDQDQVVEIPEFQVWETGDNRTAKEDRQ
jgi:hypothetical protein